MDTADSDVAYYAKNAPSIEDYRRLTLRVEGSTIHRDEAKTTQGAVAGPEGRRWQEAGGS
jgi:hypothetical protein